MHRILTLAGSLLLAGIAPAGAESLATGCLSGATGEIYGLRLYSNDTSVTCESGDSIVRLALHQPDTKFAKRRTTIAFRSHQTLANFQSELPLSVRLYLDDNLPFGGDEPTDVCELYLFYDEVVYMLASVDPNAEANGLTSIEIFHQDDRKSGTTKETTGAVHSVGSDWAVQVHDLYVANRGGEECYAAFLLEFADDPTKLYSR